MLIVLGVAVGALVQQQMTGDSLQSQVLTDRATGVAVAEQQDEQDCLKLSENAANTCFLKLALAEEDDSYCKKISKASKRRDCEREVELNI